MQVWCKKFDSNHIYYLLGKILTARYHISKHDDQDLKGGFLTYSLTNQLDLFT